MTTRDDTRAGPTTCAPAVAFVEHCVIRCETRRMLVGVHRLDLIPLVALVGCESPVRATPDAGIDATLDESRVPFATTGTTPAGSLDGVRYIGVSYLDGFCIPGYYVTLYETNELYTDATVDVHIPLPADLSVPPTGTIAASARGNGIHHAESTDQVSFEIVHFDLPVTDRPVVQLLRIAGRVTASTGAWNLDFAFDAQTERHGCL